MLFRFLPLQKEKAETIILRAAWMSQDSTPTYLLGPNKQHHRSYSYGRELPNRWSCGYLYIVLIASDFQFSVYTYVLCSAPVSSYSNHLCFPSHKSDSEISPKLITKSGLHLPLEMYFFLSVSSQPERILRHKNN